MSAFGRPPQFPDAPRMERVHLRPSPALLDTILDRSGAHSVTGYLQAALLIVTGEPVPGGYLPNADRGGQYLDGISANLPAACAAKVRAAARSTERSAWLERVLTRAVFDATDKTLRESASAPRGRVL